MEPENRVVVLIDMDCFYCQVEEKLDPELRGKPIAVVQYNPWKGGGIIAVNYVARARGVTRHMRGDEAKDKCPEIQLPVVPCLRGKADISKYRDAGKEVARVLQRFTPLLERASIDEAYLDITAKVQERLKTLNINNVNTDMMPNTHALGYNAIEEFMLDVHNCGSDSIEFDYEHAKRLLIGAVIASEIRAAVFEETGYRCSAGIAHNKILAKLVCGMNKPDKQTVLPKHCIDILYKTLSIKKVKHLGGKFGETVCDLLRINNMGELQRFTERELQAKFDDKNGTWLYNIARGVDLEPVQARFNPKSIGCCKQLRGKSALRDLDSLRRWLRDLGDEIEDRLEKDAVENNRTPKQMVVSFSTLGAGGRDCSSSRSYNLPPRGDDRPGGELLARKAAELVLDTMEGGTYTDNETNRKLRAPITFLGISVGKFEDNSDKKVKKINEYFGVGKSYTNKVKEDTKQNINKEVKKEDGKEYILQKFFNAQTVKNKENNDDKSKDVIKDNKENIVTPKTLESPLDKQESFFARFLNKDNRNLKQDNATIARVTTPLCNIVNQGDDDSSDTNYSSSTINMEINKSIALFEDEPNDTARVSNMRELLKNSSAEAAKNDSKGSDEQEEHNKDDTTRHSDDKEQRSPTSTKEQDNQQQHEVETFKCLQCGKTLPHSMFETHSDYHFALTIREEERQRVRDEFKDRTRTKLITNDVKKNKQDTNEESKKKKKDLSVNKVPLASFFVKINDTTPTETCPVCGKKIPVEKFAEHSDFHEAQKLSREINNRRAISTLQNVFKNNNVKRKRTSISPTKKPKLHCPSKSIDSFFR